MANLVIGKRTRTHQEGGSSSDSTKGSWQTVRRDTKSQLTYADKMTLAFASTAIMTVLVLVAVLSVVWEGQFQKYTRANMERLAVSTAQSLSELYDAHHGWSDEAFAHVASINGVTGDVGIQILNDHGDVLYDDTLSATDAQSPSHKEYPVKTRTDFTPIDSESSVSAPIKTASGKQVGEVKVWAFGSNALLTKSDAAFRVNSYGAIWAAAAIAVILACVVGMLVSKSLTRPIKRITDTAAQIRNGDLTARTHLVGDDEIGRLGETFDDMATSLEKDLKLEHRLTSDVAHELRTPLMAMLATVEAMQDGVLPFDEERLDVVAHEVKRLSRLVDAMLHLSRMESGSIPFKPEPTEMVSLTSSLVLAQEQMFREKGLRLRFSDNTPKHECFAEVDRDMIHQAIINLMSNAIRYTPEGGWVLVKIGQTKTDVEISVVDTGIGIAKEDLTRVFSRFWRSDASRERESGGLGVGLAVTKEIIDKHHGYISVDSELGRGTTFTLHIPREYRSLQQDSSNTNS